MKTTDVARHLTRSRTKEGFRPAAYLKIGSAYFDIVKSDLIEHSRLHPNLDLPCRRDAGGDLIFEAKEP